MRILGHFGKALSLAVFLAAVCSAQRPSFTAVGVRNAASGETTLAPHARARIVGSNLGPLQIVSAQTPAGAQELVGVQVTFSQAPGALIDVSDTLITVDIPQDLPTGPVDVVVSYNGIASDPVTIDLEAFAPAFYTTTAPDGTVTGAFGGADTISIDKPANPGEALTGVANGLGPASGDPPMQLTDSVPSVTVGCDQAQVQASFFNTDFGTYQVDFAVPQGTPGGLIPISMTLGGVSSPTVLLPVSGDPTPAICAAVNAASFAPGQAVAPGSILTLFGVNLSSMTDLAAFPNNLVGGASVVINGTAVPFFAATPGQVNVLIPPQLPASGLVDVQVYSDAGDSNFFQIEMTSAAPGVFPVRDPRDSSKIYAAALRGNTAWLAIPKGMAQAFGIATDCMANGVNAAAACGEPVRRGDALQIYVTGLGRATAGGDPNGALLPAGEVAPADASVLYETLSPPQVKIGEAAAQVLFSGLAPGFAGADQLNVIVPETAPVGDEVPLTITAANGMSATVLVAVR